MQHQPAERRRIAIIGSGIAGLTCAHLLSPHREVVLYEAADRLGGHTNTVSVDDALAGELGVDTGFIVHNRRNYPGFTALLDDLRVDTQPAEMSFAVTDRQHGLTYRATNPSTIFADRRNVLRRDIWSMLTGIRRFWRDAHALLGADEPDEERTLGDVLDAGRYSEAFVEWHLRPMIAAIWSAAPGSMEGASAVATLRFLDNHGLLGLGDRPQWRTIVGGSRRYVEAIVDRFDGKINTGWPVRSVARTADGGVEVSTELGRDRFDEVILACHTDQALQMIEQPSNAERAILGAIGYQDNLAVLHTDERHLPPTRRAWAAWNVDVDRADAGGAPVRVTYDLTTLQRLPTDTRYLVTLNPGEATPDGAIRTIHYSHPILDAGARAAQRRLPEINGADGLYFCGAWAGHGFHEDGVAAAREVCRLLGIHA